MKQHTIHIAPLGNAREGSGRGTPSSPLRLLSLDGRLQDPVTYLLAPGKYLTRGCWANLVNPSARIIAAIGGSVSIVLFDPLLRTGVRWTNILWFGDKNSSPTLPPGLLQGVQLRVDESVQATDISYGGVYFWGTGSPVDCFARARGSFERGEETFAFGSAFAFPGLQRWSQLGAVVEGYASGISTGTSVDSSVLLVDHFHCHAIRPAYAGIIPGSGVIFQNGRCDGVFRYGVAHDTQPLEGCQIQQCRFVSTYTAIHLVRQKEDWHQAGLRVRNCRFHVQVLAAGQEAIFMGLITKDGLDPKTSLWTDIDIDDTDFTTNHASPYLLSSNGGIGAPRLPLKLTTQNLKINGPIKPQHL